MAHIENGRYYAKRTEEYTDRDGKERTAFRDVAFTVVVYERHDEGKMMLVDERTGETYPLLPPRDRDGGGQGNRSGGRGRGSSSRTSHGSSRSSGRGSRRESNEPNWDDENDPDVPF